MNGDGSVCDVIINQAGGRCSGIWVDGYLWEDLIGPDGDDGSDFVRTGWLLSFRLSVVRCVSLLSLACQSLLLSAATNLLMLPMLSRDFYFLRCGWSSGDEAWMAGRCFEGRVDQRAGIHDMTRDQNTSDKPGATIMYIQQFW